MEKRFLSILQNMRLNQLETSALRLAIARSDPLIKSSLEQFKGDLDEPRLSDNLRLVALKTIQSTLVDQGFFMGGEPVQFENVVVSEDEEEAEDNDDDDDEEEDDEEEEEEEDDEDSEEEDDDEEEEINDSDDNSSEVFYEKFKPTQVHMCIYKNIYCTSSFRDWRIDVSNHFLSPLL